MRSKNAIRLTLFIAVIVLVAIFALATGRNARPSATSKEPRQVAANAAAYDGPASQDAPHSHAHDDGRDHAHDGAPATNANHAHAASTALAPEHDHTHAAVPLETLARIARENPRLAASSSTSSDGLKETPLPGGGVMVDLEGRFQSVAIATVGPDGKIGFTCVTDIDRHGLASTNAPGASAPQTNSPAPPGR